MSDEQLRELERRWRASRSEADLTALLRERLRAGALDAARLRWAAALGEPAATAACDAPAPPWPEERLEQLRRELAGGFVVPGSWGPHAWWEVFAAWEACGDVPDLAQRMTLSCGRALLPWWREALGDAVWAPAAVEAGQECIQSRAWAHSRSGKHLSRAQALMAQDPCRVELATGSVLPTRTPADEVALALNYGRHTPGALAHSVLASCLSLYLPDESREVPNLRRVRRLEAPLNALAATALLLGSDSLRQALRDEVTPWLLGLRDPLAAGQGGR